MTSQRIRPEILACKEELIQLVENEGYSYAKAYYHLLGQGKIFLCKTHFCDVCRKLKIRIIPFNQLAALVRAPAVPAEINGASTKNKPQVTDDLSLEPELESEKERFNLNRDPAKRKKYYEQEDE